MKKIFTYPVLFPFFIIIIIVNFFIVLISKIDILDSLQGSIQDIDLTDLVYQNKGLDNKLADSTIVLVNSGQLDRANLAQIIDHLEKYKPAVLGIDIFFSELKDPVKDSLLAQSLKNSKNIVLVTESYWANRNNTIDSMKFSLPLFRNHCYQGYANLQISQKKGLYEPYNIRKFITRGIYKDTAVYSFSLEVLRHYNPEAFFHYLLRAPLSDIINFQGNENNFYKISTEDALNQNKDLSWIRNKIVLLGYLGEEQQFQRLEDVYYTPLLYSKDQPNLPDMYGMVIHANIISMILHHDYKKDFSRWSWVIHLLIVYFFLFLCNFIYHRNEHNYALLTIVSTFIVINLLLLVTIVSFKYFDLKLSLEGTIFYVVIVPESLEIYKKNMEKYLNRLKLKKWLILILFILISIGLTYWGARI